MCSGDGIDRRLRTLFRGKILGFRGGFTATGGHPNSVRSSQARDGLNALTRAHARDRILNALTVSHLYPVVDSDRLMLIISILLEMLDDVLVFRWGLWGLWEFCEFIWS